MILETINYYLSELFGVSGSDLIIIVLLVAHLIFSLIIFFRG